MIGTKFYKNELNLIAYSAAAEWCNANNACIEDMGDFYEVKPTPPISEEERAILKKTYQDSDAGRIAAMEERIARLEAFLDADNK